MNKSYVALDVVQLFVPYKLKTPTGHKGGAYFLKSQKLFIFLPECTSNWLTLTRLEADIGDMYIFNRVSRTNLYVLEYYCILVIM